MTDYTAYFVLNDYSCGEITNTTKTMTFKGEQNKEEAFLWAVRCIRRCQDLSEENKIIALETVVHEYLHWGSKALNNGEKFEYEFEREDDYGDAVSLRVSVKACKH
jgi:hypothetical protein